MPVILNAIGDFCYELSTGTLNYGSALAFLALIDMPANFAVAGSVARALSTILYVFNAPWTGAWRPISPIGSEAIRPRRFLMIGTRKFRNAIGPSVIEASPGLPQIHGMRVLTTNPMNQRGNSIAFQTNTRATVS